MGGLKLRDASPTRQASGDLASEVKQKKRDILTDNMGKISIAYIMGGAGYLLAYIDETGSFHIHPKN